MQAQNLLDYGKDDGGLWTIWEGKEVVFSTDSYAEFHERLIQDYGVEY